MGNPYILVDTGDDSDGTADLIPDDELSEFYVHTATVETFEGSNGYGADVFATPFTLDPSLGNGCWIESSRSLVRDKTGEQVISETKLYARLAYAPYFTPDSRVTADGVDARVISVKRHDGATLDLPDHIEVYLT